MFAVFNEKKLPELLKESQVTTAAELDAQLRKSGSSLLKQQRLFMEEVLGREMVRQNLDVDDEISHEELLANYYGNPEKFSQPARARFEQLMVRWSQFETKQQALAHLVGLGNQVYRGADFADVARAGSQGPRAHEGGRFDWTTRGALRSVAVDEAIFRLPVNQLGEIIQDDQGAYIIRVLEREEAGRVKFDTVQDEIRESIRQERISHQIADYLRDLRNDTHVWTAFDAPADASEQIARPPESTRLR